MSHESHCYQDEYKDSCKYGDLELDPCPMRFKNMAEQTWYLTFWNGVRLISKDITVTNKAYLANAVLTPMNVDLTLRHFKPDHICLEDTSDDHILIWNYNKTEVLGTLSRSASEAFEEGRLDVISSNAY